MNLAWKVSLPHADKLVLLALADNANDEGLCWPRVQTLTEKCGMDERTVQRVIQRLQTAGHVTITPRAGRSNYYTVHPRQSATPGVEPPRQRATIPPAQRHPTPGAAPPRIFKEPSGEPGEVRAARADTAQRLPDGFELTAERKAYAEREGIDAQREFDKFTDHYRSAGGASARKRDWDAAWRNWCRRAADDARRQARPPLRGSPIAPAPAARPQALCDHGLDRGKCVYCRRAAAVPA